MLSPINGLKTLILRFYKYFVPNGTQDTLTSPTTKRKN
jgi:hypothetical protein